MLSPCSTKEQLAKGVAEVLSGTQVSLLVIGGCSANIHLGNEGVVPWRYFTNL